MDRIKLKLLRIQFVNIESKGEYFGYITGFTAVSATGKTKKEVFNKLSKNLQSIFIMANPEFKPQG